MSSLLDTALRYHAAGLIVLPNDPAKKFPAGLDGWQTFTPTEANIRAWYTKPGRAIGIRDQEGVDFDNKGHPSASDLYTEWHESVEALAPGLVQKLLMEQTPSGGYHLAWRCEVIAGNQKLATRPPTNDELQSNPKLTFVSLIETRGKGGQFQVAPSPGYNLIRGDWCDLPRITPAERQILLDCARALTQADRRTHDALSTTGQRPGDLYNRQNADEALYLLEQAGWRAVYRRGNAVYLCRPGKKTGVSATFGYVAPGVFYVFSSNASPFEAGRAYPPFAVYAELEHGGDYKKAAQMLAGQRAVNRVTGEIVSSASAPLAKTVDPYPELNPTIGSDLMRKDIPPTRHFVQNIIRSGLAFFIGQPGVGKTPALIQLAIAFATGGLWLGAFRVPKIRVAYIGPEYDEGDVRNIIMESTGGRANLDNLLIFTIENFSGPKTEEEALQLIDKLVQIFKVEAIIIDLLPGFLPPEKFKQNAYRGDYREFLAYHRTALGYQIAIIGAWHGTKRDANPATMYNGGQGFWGSAGGGRMVMYQDETDQVKLYSQLRGNKAVTYTMAEGYIAGCRIWSILEGSEPEPAFGSDVHRAIYHVVKDHAPAHGLTPKTIAGLVQPELDKRVGEPYIRKCISVLVKRGLLTAIGDAYVVKGSQGSQGSQGIEGSEGSDDAQDLRDDLHSSYRVSDPSDPSPIPDEDRGSTAYQNGNSGADPSDPSFSAIPEKTPIMQGLADRLKQRGTPRVLTGQELNDALTKDNPDTTFTALSGTPIDEEEDHAAEG